MPCRAAVQKGARHYEFPTGFNYYFGAERLLVGEQYFVHSPQLLVSATLEVYFGSSVNIISLLTGVEPEFA